MIILDRQCYWVTELAFRNPVIIYDEANINKTIENIFAE